MRYSFIILKCLLLFGCSSSSDPANTITMWDNPESEAYTQWWRNYGRKFEEANPDITIKIEIFETESYKAKWGAVVVANALPDIFYQTPRPEIEIAYREGKLLHLDDLLEADRFSPAALEQCLFDGHVAGMPLYFAPSFIYCNKTLFARAQIDPQQWAFPIQPVWDEFLTACEALKKANITPIALGNAENWPGLHWYWMFQNRYGGLEELSTAVEDSGSFLSPGFIKAGELIQILFTRGYFTEGFNSLGDGRKYAIWTQGTAGAMIYQGPWLLGQIEDTAPPDFEWGFFHFSRFSDGKPDSQQDVLAGIDALWVSASTPHQTQVAEFLNGFSNPETQLDFVLKTHNIPAVENIQPPPGNTNDPIWKLAEAMQQAGRIISWWDVSYLSPPVKEAMLSMSQQLLIGEITPNTFAFALDKAAER